MEKFTKNHIFFLMTWIRICRNLRFTKKQRCATFYKCVAISRKIKRLTFLFVKSCRNCDLFHFTLTLSSCLKLISVISDNLMPGLFMQSVSLAFLDENEKHIDNFSSTILKLISVNVFLKFSSGGSTKQRPFFFSLVEMQIESASTEIAKKAKICKSTKTFILMWSERL